MRRDPSDNFLLMISAALMALLLAGCVSMVYAAKERGIPAMYFTNQLASRPFFLMGGMAATIDFVASVLTKGDKYRWMQEFFAD